MIKISLLTGEIIFTVLWLLIRWTIWIQQKKIVWKREAFLLLMYINLAILIRFVFYPFFTVNGQVQPLIINMKSIQPLRVNLIPLVNILDYDIKREATVTGTTNVKVVPTEITVITRLSRKKTKALAMRFLLRLITLPIRIIITVFVLLCSIVLSLSGVFFGIASDMLGLLGLIVLTYSAHNALILFALVLLVSSIGLPMIAVGVLSVLCSVRSFLRFS